MDQALTRLAAINEPIDGLCRHDLSRCTYCHPSIEDPARALLQQYQRATVRDRVRAAREKLPQVSVTIVPVPTTEALHDPLPPRLTDWAGYPKYLPRRQNPAYAVVPSDQVVTPEPRQPEPVMATATAPVERVHTIREVSGNFNQFTQSRRPVWP